MWWFFLTSMSFFVTTFFANSDTQAHAHIETSSDIFMPCHSPLVFIRIHFILNCFFVIILLRHCRRLLFLFEALAVVWTIRSAASSCQHTCVRQEMSGQMLCCFSVWILFCYVGWLIFGDFAVIFLLINQFLLTLSVLLINTKKVDQHFSQSIFLLRLFFFQCRSSKEQLPLICIKRTHTHTLLCAHTVHHRIQSDFRVRFLFTEFLNWNLISN